MSAPNYPLRLSPLRRAGWKRAAELEGRTLAGWIKATCDKQVERTIKMATQKTNLYWYSTYPIHQALDDLEAGHTVQFWDRTDRFASLSPDGEIKVWHRSGKPYSSGQDYSVRFVCEILRNVRQGKTVPPTTLDSCLSYLGPMQVSQAGREDGQ